MHNGFLRLSNHRASEKDMFHLLAFLERSLSRHALKDALERYIALSTRGARIQALELLEHINAGNTLSSYLQLSGNLPAYMLTTLQAGEDAGELHFGIQQALHYRIKVSGFVRKLLGSLVYPFIVLLFCCVAFLFLLFWFVPVMVRNFLELSLPVPGLLMFLNTLSGTLHAHMPLAGLLVIAAGGSFWYLLRNKRPYLVKIASRLPLIRHALYAWDRHQFYLFLSLSLRSKPDVSACLMQIRRVLSTERGRRDLLGIYSELSSGKKFSESIPGTIFATPEIIRSLQLGEEAQNFADSVNDIVEASQEKADRLLDLVKALVEPGMTVIIGICVMILALLLMQPFRAIVEHIQF